MIGKVHHLNCGTLYPLSDRFMTGAGSWFSSGLLVCHCLLVETDDGLLLVDTGIGPGDLAVPGWQMWPFGLVTRPSRDPEETAARQIARLGFDPGDVRHLVLTHLHLDHAGGLVDFPQAHVHLSAAEYQAVTNPQNLASVTSARRPSAPTDQNGSGTNHRASVGLALTACPWSRDSRQRCCWCRCRDTRGE